MGAAVRFRAVTLPTRRRVTMPSSPAPIIETRGLSKTYKGTQALQGLDLRVQQNSIFAFLGPNGAGKTTTIRLLLGLARPTSGSGSVFGLDIARDSVAIRRRIGYLPQDPRYYDYMTARETLRFTAEFFYSGPAPAIEERVAETLALVGLADKADRPIKGFSGGERQRLGIAQAQVNYPDLLILDEPAAALDPQGRRDVLEVMERLRRHTTIFYSTHILSDVQRVSDTVAILNRGRLVTQAPIEQLLNGGQAGTFSLTVKGEAGAAQARLTSQPWVAGVQATPVNGHVRWEVSVTDPAAAEAHLLRVVLADEAVSVLEYGRKQVDLEEIFLALTNGGENGRHN
jgi:ABC-2 type transport system ATP-binding protein